MTPLKSFIVSFFHFSYPFNLFAWRITHLSPHGPLSEAQINSPEIARFPLVDVLMTALWTQNFVQNFHILNDVAENAIQMVTNYAESI